MGDPIKDLHQQMLENDLLEGANVDFNNFRNSVFAPGGAQKLYGVLKDNGAADMSLADFTANIESLKKKDTGGSDQSTGSAPSLSTPKENASAPTAQTNSTSDFFETSMGAPDFQQNAKDLGVPDGQIAQPTETTVQGLDEASLMKMGMDTPASESTRQDIAIKPIYKPTTFTGDEDPLAVGKGVLKERYQNFSEKEANANKSALRKGAFELDVLGKTSLIARDQALYASAQLDQKFGPDWSEFLIKAGRTIENPPANLSPMEIEGLKYRYNQIVEDENYKQYSGGVQFAQKAKAQFDNYAKQNPEYAQRVAQQETNKNAIDNTIAGSAWNWADRKIAQVVAGIATMPRTLLGGTGKANAYSQAIDALGDWGDQLVEDVNVEFPAPDKYSRAMWEKSAPYKDMDIVVDDKGNPQAAYKAGKKVELTEAQTKEFVESGAAKNAETRFTGVGNAGFKLADVVADLYVMRWLGGGTKLGAATSAFAIQHRQNYEEGQRDLNLNDTQAAQYAFAKSALNSVIEAYVGDIESTGVKFAAAKAVGLREAKAVAGKLPAYEVAKIAVKPVMKEIGAENAEEIIQMFGDQTANAVFNGLYGANLETDIKPQDVAETILLTTLATGLAGGGQAMRGAVNEFTETSMLAAIQNPAAMQKAFATLQENGAITEEDAARGMARTNQMADIYSRLPSDMSEEKKAKVALLEWKKMADQASYGESPSSAQQKILKEETKAADAEIQAIMMPAEVVEQETPVTEPLAEEVAAPPVVTVPELKAEEIFVSATPERDNLGANRAIPIAEREGLPVITEVAPDSRTMFDKVVEAYSPASEDLAPQIAAQEELVSKTIGDERAAAETELNRLKREQNAAADNQDAFQNALIDDTINTGLGAVRAKQRNEMTASDHAALRDFVAENLADPEFIAANKGESFQKVANDLVTEFMAENERISSPVKNLKRAFNPQTVEDHIAEAFAAGTRVQTKDLRADLPAEMQDSGIRMLYGSNKGVAIDELAEEIYTQMNSSRAEQAAGTDVMTSGAAQDIKNAILDFIKSNPKGPIQHMKNAVTTQNQDAAERFAGPEFTPEQVTQEVEKQQAVLDELPAKDITSIEKALAPYGEGDNFDADAFISDYDAWDPFDNPTSHFQQLTPKAIDKINEIRQQIGEQTRVDQPEIQGQGQDKVTNAGTAGSTAETAGSETATAAQDGADLIQEVQDATGTAALNDVAEKIDEAMQEAPLPDELTDAYLQEMLRSGIIDDTTYADAWRHVNMPSMQTPETLAAYEKAMALREQLREGPNEKIWPESLPKTNDKLDRPLVARMPDGSYQVTAAAEYADALQEAGGVYNPATNTWRFRDNQQAELDAALSSRRADGLDQVQDVMESGENAETSSLLTKAAATLRRYRNRARFKKAATFQEQLDAAKALHGLGKSVMDKATQRVLDRARKAFPNVTVVTSTEEIDRVKNEMVAFGEIPDLAAMGQVMGFERNGKVYIDPRVARPDTPVHEFGHIWNSWMRKNQPTLYAKGIDLVKGSNYYSDVLENPAYAHLSEEEKAEEALAQAIGEKGAFMTNATTLIKFQTWLSDMWSSIGRALGFSPEDLTLEQYVNRQAQMITGGKALLKETSEDIKEMKAQLGELSKFQIIGPTGAASIPMAMENKTVAEQMEKAGNSPVEIYAATGWERGRDRKWRTEIEYGNTNANVLLSGGPWNLGDLFDADKLYAAYPQMKGVKVVVNESLLPGQGSFDGNKIEVSPADLGDVEKLNNILTHEIQHGIQVIEGFDQGSNVGNNKKVSPELESALAAIVSTGQNGSPELVEQYLAENEEVAGLLDDLGEMDDFKAMAVLSTDEIDSKLKQDKEGAIIEYASAPGEIEARNAESRRAGSELPISATEDISRGVMAQNYEAAKSMQQAGMADEKIFAATGWYQNQLGEWKFQPITKVFTRAESFTEPAYQVDQVFDSPDFFSQYPDVKNWNVRFMDQENIEVRDGEIVLPLKYQSGISTVMASSLLRSAAQVDSGAMSLPMAEQKAELGNVEASVMTGAPARFAASGSQVTADYAARMISAKDILKDQLRKEGLKNIDSKIAQAASDLNLSETELKRAVEKMVLRMGYGTLRIDKGEMLDARSKTRKFMDRYNKRFAKWWQKNLTTRGLMTTDLYAANEKRIGRAAAKIFRGQQYINNLEAAMKEAYGKDLNETHWRMVDNVLRGTGDWTILPSAVGSALKQIRDMQDSVSLDLLQSGVAGGDMIVTVLNNAGIEIEPVELENYKGVDLITAFEKLPFERTVEEVDAIRNFLEENKGKIGTYMYRSYKVHDTKDWEKYKDDLDPRVLQEARDFLKNQIEDQIMELAEQSVENADAINAEIQDNKDKIARELSNLDKKITDSQDKIKEIRDKQTDYIADKGVPNQNLEKSLVAWQKKLAEFKQRSKEAKAMEIEDFDVVDALTNADIVGLPIAVKKIIGARKRIAELNEKLTKQSENNDAKLAELNHNLNNIESLINEILFTDNSPVAMLSRGKLGSKDLNSFKTRKDIPVEIRELMGEYKDPRLNFAKSLYRSVNMLENQLFLTDLKQNFMGTLFFTKPTGDAFTEISSEGNRNLRPLNGLYTTPEIAEVFDEYYQGKGQQDFFWRSFAALSAGVKYGKTILSPVTHVRNFVSNLWFAVNNAYDIRNGSKAFKAFTTAFSKKSSPEQAAYFERLTELRMIGNGANIGSIRNLMDAMNADAVDQWTEKHLGGGVNTLRENAEKLYGAEDDFYRVLAFETEKARYAKALYGAPFENLSPAEQGTIEEKAAELTIAMLPTYSKVPKIVKNIQMFPFVGTFVAFPAEMFRVTYNQLAITRAELRDPRTRHIGVRRLIGMSIAQGMIGVGLVALGKWFAGVTDEEEDAARYFSFPWQKRSSLIWQKLDGQQMSFINLSYTDPYAFLKKPIIQLATESPNTFEQDMAQAAYSFLEPFVSPELTANTIGQVIYNRDEKKKDNLYNERKGLIGDWWKVGQFLSYNLAPGVIKFGGDVYSAITQESVGNRPPKQLQDVLLSMAGMQTERRSIEQAVSSKINELKKQKEYSRQIFTDDRWKYKANPKMLKSIYESANKEYNEVLKEVKFALSAAERIGLPEKELQQIIKTANFSNEELRAIRSGRQLAPLFEGYNK